MADLSDDYFLANPAGAAGGQATPFPPETVPFLSTLPARDTDRRIARWTVGISVALFFLLTPFAAAPLAKVWAFIPAYEAALTINDLVTVVLLFGQFAILRSRSLFVLACGYLFTAGMAVVHALTFPGTITPGGLLGAGPQTTAWLYMLWHGGFPLFVIAYTLLKGGVLQRPAASIALGVGATALLVAACACLCTIGHELLPAIMIGNHYSAAMLLVVTSIWLLSFCALTALWFGKRHTVLDIWLMVVMCAWLFDIALSAVLNAGRFDLGFYAGRIYGLLAASFVLFALLLENGRLYAGLVRSHAQERQRTAELQAANQELEAFSYSVSHDLRAPLRAVNGYARMLEMRYGALFDDEGLRLLSVIRDNGVRMGRLIDDLLTFSRLGRQTLRTQPVSLDELVRQIVAELRAAQEGGAAAARFDIGPLGLVEADPAQLRQVLLNLLGNALKFTRPCEQAAIRIGMCLDEDGNTPVYYVKDNGVGFDMRYVDKLFAVFQRLHPNDEFEGSGIGLAIVHRIVTRHGGRVWAESQPGDGATFFFSLPPAPRGRAVDDA